MGLAGKVICVNWLRSFCNFSSAVASGSSGTSRKHLAGHSEGVEIYQNHLVALPHFLHFMRLSIVQEPSFSLIQLSHFVPSHFGQWGSSFAGFGTRGILCVLRQALHISGGNVFISVMLGSSSLAWASPSKSLKYWARGYCLSSFVFLATECMFYGMLQLPDCVMVTTPQSKLKSTLFVTFSYRNPCSRV